MACFAIVHPHQHRYIMACQRKDCIWQETSLRSLVERSVY